MAATTLENRGKGPRAIGRALDLLMLLTRHRRGMTLTEISTALSVPKSTFTDTLKGLHEQGYLIQVDGRYCLGAAAHRLAGRIMAASPGSDIIRIHVRLLAEKTGESVGLAIADWEIGQAIYTEAVNSTQPVRYAMQVGIRAPLYASAAGRVLLAYAPPERVAKYLERAQLRPLTAATRTSPEAIFEHLGEIRQAGFCASFGELLNDTAAIGVPVYGPDEELAGAMMLASPLNRMKANYDQYLQAIIAAGRDASGMPG